MASLATLRGCSGSSRNAVRNHPRIAFARIPQYAAKFNVPEEKVDIADLRTDSPLLRYRVATDGTLLESTREAFRRFQIEACKDHLNNNGKMSNLRSQFLRKALL